MQIQPVDILTDTARYLDMSGHLVRGPRKVKQKQLESSLLTPVSPSLGKTADSPLRGSEQNIIKQFLLMTGRTTSVAPQHLELTTKVHEYIRITERAPTMY